ncbi:hypothetical protein [Acidisphaera sp. S103]|uniref:hypothetical protein n=1 Tax=Acidisphaera sp. S103 TaxID=1747223 RepID=UPI00131CC5A0|nr:hypothetical protein [Acidisphaera sp. S103]
MTETIHPHALTAIRRALESRIPKLALLSGTPQEAVLRHATRGEVISDNDCVFDFEALDNGVYIRLQVECAGATDHRWVFLCKSDDLADILARRLQAANATEQSTVGMDAAWQSYQWAQAKRAQARRQTRGR